MKTTVIGVKRVAGNSKANGTPFDMCRLLCLTPVVQSNGKTQVNGAGSEQMELSLDKDALPLFMRLDWSNGPIKLEIELEPRPHFGKVESVVTGIKLPLAKAA